MNTSDYDFDLPALDLSFEPLDLNVEPLDLSFEPLDLSIDLDTLNFHFTPADLAIDADELLRGLNWSAEEIEALLVDLSHTQERLLANVTGQGEPAHPAALPRKPRRRARRGAR